MPETPVGRGGYCVRQYYDRIISPAIMVPHDQFSHTFITPLNVTVPAFQYNTIHDTRCSWDTAGLISNYVPW